MLHGDLSGGNQGALKDGVPVISDPACWYGDREADIAMTELFGVFGSEFYHANLFGGDYISRARELTERLLSNM